MDITLGLDFGTHQSKLCLSYMPNNEQIYEFLEFVKPDGAKTFLLPSVIQINKDDTISIGFVDKNECKRKDSSMPSPQEPIFPEEPSLELPPCPEKSYPEKPKEEKFGWKDLLSALIKRKPKNQDLIDQWERRCREIDVEWQSDYSKWLDKCEEINEIHNDWQALVEGMKRDYVSKLSAWESHQLQYYRYFKLASFSNMYPWDKEHIVDSDTLSIWYLTYLMLLVKKKVAEKFNEIFEDSVSVQMGIPSGLNINLSKQIEIHAYKLLISARKLMGQFKSPEEFCSFRYQDLLERTIIPHNNVKNTAEDFGFVVIPEAYAGLKSLTHRKRLRNGDMHLLVDIGGGTTDVAFFTVDEILEPNVHCVKSFHLGLNYVFDNYCQKHPEYSISEAQDLFMIDQQPFENDIKAYTEELNRQLSQMIDHIIHEYLMEAGRKGFYQSDLTNAMTGRPIVYCGGGSMYERMRISNNYFSDIKIVDKNMLSIPNLRNTDVDERLYTILATSYGLSIPMLGEIEMKDTISLFRNVVAAGPEPEEKRRRDYNDYEHGLTDL